MTGITLTGSAEVTARLRRAGNFQNSVVRAIAQEVVKLDKTHVSSQTDIYNASFAPRKQGRKKMEVKLGRMLQVLSSTPREALLGWRSDKVSRIAATQQFGLSTTVTLTQFKRSMAAHDASLTTTNATASQATALLAVGYKRRANGRLQTPTKKWIKDNLTRSQAGAILRTLRMAAVVTAWQINLPPRAFLGVSTADAAQLQRLLHEQVASDLAR